MGKIYAGQSALKIRVTTGIDINSAPSVKIKWRKPDPIKKYIDGEFDAEIEDASNGIIYYDIKNSQQIDRAGEWKFWAYVTFPDGRSAPGDPAIVKIFEEGE